MISKVTGGIFGLASSVRTVLITKASSVQTVLISNMDGSRQEMFTTLVAAAVTPWFYHVQYTLQYQCAYVPVANHTSYIYLPVTAMGCPRGKPSRFDAWNSHETLLLNAPIGVALFTGIAMLAAGSRLDPKTHKIQRERARLLMLLSFYLFWFMVGNWHLLKGKAELYIGILLFAFARTVLVASDVKYTQTELGTSVVEPFVRVVRR
jgi:hypothetical protein